MTETMAATKREGKAIRYQGKDYPSVRALANAFGFGANQVYHITSRYTDNNHAQAMDMLLKQRDDKPKLKKLSKERLNHLMAWKEDDEERKEYYGE